jgi:hypothetical protein
VSTVSAVFAVFADVYLLVVLLGAEKHHRKTPRNRKNHKKQRRQASWRLQLRL